MFHQTLFLIILLVLAFDGLESLHAAILILLAHNGEALLRLGGGLSGSIEVSAYAFLSTLEVGTDASILRLADNHIVQTDQVLLFCVVMAEAEIDGLAGIVFQVEGAFGPSVDGTLCLFHRLFNQCALSFNSLQVAKVFCDIEAIVL